MGYFDNIQKKDIYLNPEQKDFTEDYGLGGGTDTWSKTANSAAYIPQTDAQKQSGLQTTSQVASLWSPAIGVAGMFLSNLMAQRAAAEEKKKQLAIELALKGGKDTSEASQQMINVYKDILTRG